MAYSKTGLEGIKKKREQYFSENEKYEEKHNNEANNLEEKCDNYTIQHDGYKDKLPFHGEKTYLLFSDFFRVFFGQEDHLKNIEEHNIAHKELLESLPNLEKTIQSEWKENPLYLENCISNFHAGMKKKHIEYENLHTFSGKDLAYRLGERFATSPYSTDEGIKEIKKINSKFKDYFSQNMNKYHKDILLDIINRNTLLTEKNRQISFIVTGSC